ncbi:hypothetical protein BD413DRAFT_53276 [Trametes elegans]|nr:hypothetical protein BD413DRAFT_53276 [Trametes elegans]
MNVRGIALFARAVTPSCSLILVSIAVFAAKQCVRSPLPGTHPLFSSLRCSDVRRLLSMTHWCPMAMGRRRRRLSAVPGRPFANPHCFPDAPVVRLALASEDAGSALAHNIFHRRWLEYTHAHNHELSAVGLLFTAKTD